MTWRRLAHTVASESERLASGRARRPGSANRGRSPCRRRRSRPRARRSRRRCSGARPVRSACPVRRRASATARLDTMRGSSGKAEPESHGGLVELQAGPVPGPRPPTGSEASVRPPPATRPGRQACAGPWPPRPARRTPRPIPRDHATTPGGSRPGRCGCCPTGWTGWPRSRPAGSGPGATAARPPRSGPGRARPAAGRRAGRRRFG